MWTFTAVWGSLIALTHIGELIPTMFIMSVIMITLAVMIVYNTRR